MLASRAVVNTDAFKKQSRTSERWLRILEVGQPDVATFLQEQRAAGYTIIGMCHQLGILGILFQRAHSMQTQCTKT